MKKFLSILLAVVLVLSTFTVGFAGAVDMKVNETTLKTKSKGIITLSAAPADEQYAWGDEVVFNVDVTNNTGTDYENVKVRAQANKAKFFYDGESNTVAVGSIKAGETQTIQISVKSSTPGILQRLIVLPIYYIFDFFSPMAFKASDYDATALAKVGLFKYKFGFDVTDGSPKQAKPTEPDKPDVPVEPDKEVTISFNLNYAGAPATIPAQTVKAGEKAAAVTAPVRSGYTFMGWFTNPSCEEEYRFSFLFPIYDDLTVYAKWRVNNTDSTENYIDTDNDGLLDEDENDIGTDINNPDTDSDGFTDFEEYILMGTDPLTPNTLDDELDSDEDRITDYDEIKQYRTDPYSVDTDTDGLSDYDEIFVYFTDPTKEDTDGDGLKDGFEVAHGLNPLSSTTDGINNDATVKISQELSEKAISDSLLEDNDLVPSLSGTTSGDISEEIFLAYFEDTILENERSIIGKPVYVDGEDKDINGLSLSFDLSEYRSDKKNLCICAVNEDGTYTPMESSVEDDSLSCTLAKGGEYVVVDLYEFLNGLGIDLSVSGTSKAPARKTKGTAGQADVVFCVDTTGSMSDEISNVISNAVSFSDKLATDYNVAVNFALIDYKDLQEDGAGTTKVINNGSSKWYSDVESFKAAMRTLRVNGGGDTPECAVDALETARRLDFRRNADKFIILVTDANYKIRNDYGIASMEEEAKLLMEDGIVVSVVTSTGYQSTYSGLYELTDGVFGNINGNFSTELLKLADLIGTTTSDGEWVIVKYGYKYIKIPAIPKADDLTDTDGDGIPDAVELGEITEIDLTKLIAAYFGGIGKTIDEYSGPTTVIVYDAVSDPTTDDSDGDGIADGEDSSAFVRGLKNNIIGELSIVSGGSNAGHSWLMFRPYTNEEFPVFGVSGVLAMNLDPNFGDGKIEVYKFYNKGQKRTYSLKAGHYISIGLGGLTVNNSDTGSKIKAKGMFINRECKMIVDDVNYYPNISAYSKPITKSQFGKLVKEINDAQNNWYNVVAQNCCIMAVKLWESLFGNSEDLRKGLSPLLPHSLQKNIKKLDGGISNYTDKFKSIVQNEINIK